MAYIPVPIDTSAVELNDNERLVADKLARNNHEVWAKQRLVEGWQYGPQRDDARKQHPGLIPFHQLPEHAKDDTRTISAEMVKTLIKLGYTIQAPEGTEPAAIPVDFLSQQLQPGSIDTLDILSLWRRHNAGHGKKDAQRYLQLAKTLLRQGEALTAYDVLTAALAIVEEDRNIDDNHQRRLYSELHQQRALALTHSGAYIQARHDLEALAGQIGEDSETCALLGRTYKEAANHTTDSAQHRSLLRQAQECYQKGFDLAQANGNSDAAYYPGINAATLALLCGEQALSQRLIRKVKVLCQQQLDKLCAQGTEPPFWLLATMGEAELVLGHGTAAKTSYEKARHLLGEDLRALASMHDQARQIAHHLSLNIPWLAQVLAPPSVVVFCGHRIDLPGRFSARFPQQAEEKVRQQIAQMLDRLNAGTGYSAAACGADILFLEEMIRRGKKVIVILPFEREHFLHTSVADAEGNWPERFAAVMEKANEVRVLGSYDVRAANSLYDFTNRYLFGIAQTHSHSLKTSFHALAVWNGDQDGNVGGTASAVNLWRQHTEVWQLHPMQHNIILLPQCETTTRQEKPVPVADGAIHHHHHLFMLFADIKGYSQLSESQLAAFAEYFLDYISKIAASFDDGILARHTQGDGLFLVFDQLESALGFARALRDETAAIDWSRYKLPRQLSYRIALDAGPCFSYRDPVSGDHEYCGHYVVRAARMEPITPPGHIFASETFVALARMSGVPGVVFNYAGKVNLPKNYGQIQAFHVS